MSQLSCLESAKSDQNYESGRNVRILDESKVRRMENTIPMSSVIAMLLISTGSHYI